MTDYLTAAEVLAIHADQIHRYGGSEGIRDYGLLEAALYRPQTGYYADLIAEAAARITAVTAFCSKNRRHRRDIESDHREQLHAGRLLLRHIHHKGRATPAARVGPLAER